MKIIIILLVFGLIFGCAKEEYDSAAPTYESLYNSSVTKTNWTHMGPLNVGGRTRSLLIQGDSASSIHTLYAGGVTGGVFKSTDGGESWKALNDLMPNINVNTLAQDPKNNNVIYAGTGERYGGFKGAGIFKTEDAGANWTSLDNSSDIWFVNKIVVSPNNSDVIYAATSGIGSAGLKKSVDKGITWTNIHSDYSVDVAVVNKDGTDYVYGYSEWKGLIVSFDGGANFTHKVGSSSILLYDYTTPNYSRGSIAFSKSTPSRGYLLVSNAAGQLYGIWKTSDYGANWTKTISQDNDTTKTDSWLLSDSTDVFDHNGNGKNCFEGTIDLNDLRSQGNYDQYITVDPADADVVWVGGIELFRSDSAAASGSFNKASVWYGSEGSYVHADQHYIAFSPTYDGSTDKRAYFTNDGGVFVSTNSKTGTTANPCEYSSIGVEYKEIVKGYGTTQYYHGVVSKDGKYVVGGLQDQGVTLYHGSSDNWTTIAGGDGAYNAIDPDNSSIMYSSYIYISIRRHDITVENETGAISNYYGGSISSGIDTSTYGKGAFINPFILDPNNSSKMYTANKALWRSDNVKAASTSDVTWTNLGTFDGSNSGFEITIAPSNSKVMYVGVGNSASFYRILNPADGP